MANPSYTKSYGRNYGIVRAACPANVSMLLQHYVQQVGLVNDIRPDALLQRWPLYVSNKICATHNLIKLLTARAWCVPSRV